MTTSRPATRPTNYSTEVPVSRTVAACTDMLASAGATGVTVTYLDGEYAGLVAHLRGETFVLPVDIPAMQRVMRGAEEDGLFKGHRTPKGSGGFATETHAARVAWRVLHDWLRAQLALAAAQQARLEETLLPYLVVGIDPGGEPISLRDRWRDNPRALMAGGEA